MKPARQTYNEEEAVAQVGKGWESLVRSVYTTKRALGSNANIITVKEKLGGLRIYIDCYDDVELDKVINTAGKLSLSTCEECGDIGQLRKKDNSWYLTRCEAHANGAIIIEGWPNAGF